MNSKGKAIKASYRLIVESFPSGRGRHSEEILDDEYIEACTTRRTIGSYNTEADAIQAAKVQRKATCQFVGWADDLYKDDSPPYHSAGCIDPDLDEDEDVSIFIEDISAIDKAKAKEMRIAKADPPPKKKAKLSLYAIGTKIIKPFDGEPYKGEVISYDTKSKFYQVQYEDGDGEELDSNEVKSYLAEEPKKIPSVKKEKKKKPRTTERKFGTVTGPITNVAVIDENIFLRNPCRVAGGKQHLPREYGNSGTCKPINSYYYLLQRLSDRNYAMRGLCIDGDGAQYTSFKKASILNKCVVFLPETDLNDHADDPTIVDACHLDLICPSSGECFLTAENLLKAVTPRTECIFINGYQAGGVGGTSQRKVNPNVIVDAIDICRENLQCFSFTESVLTNEILFALAKCKKLKGVMLSMTQKYTCDKNKYTGDKNDSTQASDKGIESILLSCADLSWLFVEEAAMLFREASWKALDSTDVCSKLEVLWISSYHKKDDRHHVTRGDHSVIRRVLSNRYATLKLCMINPDEKLKSRYTIGGSNKTDRLEGDKKKAYSPFS